MLLRNGIILRRDGGGQSMIKEWVFQTAEPLTFSHRSVLDSDNWYKDHMHDGLEILLIHEGEGILEIGEERHVIQPNTLMIIPPFKVHKVEVDSTKEKPYIRSMFLVQAQLLKSLFSGLLPYEQLVDQLIKQPLTHYIYDYSKSKRTIELILDTISAVTKEASPSYQKPLIALSLGQLLACIEPDLVFEIGQIKVPYVIQVMEWIESHMADKISLDWIAEDLNLSKFYLSHMFKEATGISLMAYVDQKKLEHVCTVLRTTDKSLLEIGLAIGIKDPSYFSKWFKKYKGMTPNKYRSSKAK